MSTQFQTFNPGDLIEDTHIEQYIAPIQALESGSSQYRVATNVGDAYKVDFSDDNEIDTYTTGLVIRFKAPSNNSGPSTLTVTGPSGDLADINLVKDSNTPLSDGDIVQGQIVCVVYNEDSGSTNPRFQLLGGVGKQSISEKGQPDGYAGLDENGKVPATQLPPGSGGTPAWGDITGSVSHQPDLFDVFATRGLKDVLEAKPIPNSTTYQMNGLQAFTGQGGSYASRIPSSGSAKSKMSRIGFLGSTSAVSGWRSNQSATAFTGDFFLVYHFALSDPTLVSGARMFVGLSDSLAAATNVDPASITQCIGIAQLSGDNTQFHAVWGAGSSNSEALGLPFDVNTVYRLEISSSSSANFQLRLTDLGAGTSVTINKTTGPTSATNLYFRVWRTSNGSASTSGIESGNFYLERNFG